jgi:uncharacterized protein (TIGR03435 family)
MLIPSEYTAPSGGWAMSRSNLAIGIRMPAHFVVQSAYDWKSNSRMIFADDVPEGEFDFIANLPTGSLEALQGEIKKRWGIVAVRELRQTNVVVLKLDHTNAPGLRIATGSPAPVQLEAAAQTVRSRSLESFATSLETMLRLPVVDQTGLTNLYDVQFPRVRVSGGLQDDNFKLVQSMVLDRLGLDLVQTNMPIEMLVVKKVSGGNP